MLPSRVVVVLYALAAAARSPQLLDGELVIVDGVDRPRTIRLGAAAVPRPVRGRSSSELAGVELVYQAPVETPRGVFLVLHGCALPRRVHAWRGAATPRPLEGRAGRGARIETASSGGRVANRDAKTDGETERDAKTHGRPQASRGRVYKNCAQVTTAPQTRGRGAPAARRVSASPSRRGSSARR